MTRSLRFCLFPFQLQTPQDLVAGLNEVIHVLSRRGMLDAQEQQSGYIVLRPRRVAERTGNSEDEPFSRYLPLNPPEMLGEAVCEVNEVNVSRPPRPRAPIPKTEVSCRRLFPTQSTPMTSVVNSDKMSRSSSSSGRESRAPFFSPAPAGRYSSRTPVRIESTPTRRPFTSANVPGRGWPKTSAHARGGQVCTVTKIGLCWLFHEMIRNNVVSDNFPMN